jgi:recombinational DNA repair ATPase RecF
LLSQTHPAYLSLLSLHAALRARNAYSTAALDEPAMASFTANNWSGGDRIILRRRELLPRLSPQARLRIGAFPMMRRTAARVLPSVKQDFAVELAQTHRREVNRRTTLVGPHLDDPPLAQ